jgi:hypothetical protein
VVLIGKADVDTSRLRDHPNIHMLGPKSFDELPSYVAHFTVGLIPYVINEQTRAINPIKLREMMAAGISVVTTEMPEVRGQKSEVRKRRGEGLAGRAIGVADSTEEFVAMVKERLANPLGDDERRELSESVSGETWDAKVEQILGLITAVT